MKYLKISIKYIILLPVAAVWDGISFFFEQGTLVVKHLDEKLSKKFNAAVEWCDDYDR